MKMETASRTTVRKLIKHGAVQVDGKRATRSDTLLVPGQVVEIVRKRPGRKKAPVPAAPHVTVLYEDDSVLVVDKPPDMLSMSRFDNKAETFLHRVNRHIQSRRGAGCRVFLVHRLDREVSGVMLFAFSADLKRALQKSWEQTEKRYLALVEGAPPEPEGTVRGWLRENIHHKVYSCPESPDAQYAVTHYRVVTPFPRHSLLEIQTETGRKNQIRVHLSDLGCPIVGDRKYGARENPIRRLGLHASLLSFIHPVTGSRMTINSPPPRCFERFGKK